MAEGPTIDALVDKILDGTAATHVRRAAARGALPLPRAVLVRLYVVLLEDEDAEIRATAEQSLGVLGAEEVGEVLSEPSCAPEILSHFAKRACREESLAERIAFHTAVPDRALALMAAAGNAAVIDLVMTNQERLLAAPVLLERLMINPALRADQRGRILDFLERASKLAERAGTETEGAEEDEEDLELDMAEAARLLEVDVGELLSTSEILGAEELEASEDPEIRSAFQKIIELNSAQKAILAMKGGREERQILIRDTNKVVALGVLKNPRITEPEIESIARMRNVTDEVLRRLGSTRDWIKRYSVINALVNNPRTPQGVSTNFIPRLSNRDLKSLASNRDVPELVRRNAKRTHDLRTQRQSGSFRKK